MFFKIEHAVQNVVKIVITLSFIAMFISTLIQVAARLLNISIVGTAEISLLNMTFLTFLGVGLAIYTKDHIAIEVTELISSEKVRFVIQLISTMFMLAFGIAFLYVVYPFFEYTVQSGEKTLELSMPVAVPIGSMVIGAGLVIIHSIGSILRLIYRNKRPSNQ